MTKILLVDDQPREIEGIKMLLDWNKLGIDIVGEAGNGREGLRQIQILEPDIVITDIVMPDMDGIAMLSKMREIVPHIRIICISCFDDFKFVSMAINYGASGYVLKPILANELEQAICRVRDEIIKTKEENKLLGKITPFINNDKLFRNAISKYLLTDNALFANELIKSAGWPDIFLIVAVSGYYDNYEIFAENLHGVSFIEGTNQVLLLPIYNTGEVNKVITDLRDKLIYNNCNLSAGVSGICKLAELPYAYRQAYIALDASFAHKSPYLQTFNDIPNQPTSVSNSTMYMSFRDAFIKGTDNAVSIVIDTFFTNIGRCNAMLRARLAESMLSVINGESETTSDFEYKLNTCNDIEDIRNLLNNMIKEALEKRTANSTDWTINHIKSYIRDHLSEPISIKDILRDAYISPGYANMLFKQHTKQTIHQYIQSQRLNKAVELLCTLTETHIYDIAAMVGFDDAAYFINVFKRVFGCTPVKYRRINKDFKGLNDS